MRQKLSKKLLQAVEKEINNHSKWCSPNCNTFLPQEYREKRIVSGYDAKTVQNNYDFCHIFR